MNFPKVIEWNICLHVSLALFIFWADGLYPTPLMSMISPKPRWHSEGPRRGEPVAVIIFPHVFYVSSDRVWVWEWNGWETYIYVWWTMYIYMLMLAENKNIIINVEIKLIVLFYPFYYFFLVSLLGFEPPVQHASCCSFDQGSVNIPKPTLHPFLVYTSSVNGMLYSPPPHTVYITFHEDGAECRSKRIDWLGVGFDFLKFIFHGCGLPYTLPLQSLISPSHTFTRAYLRAHTPSRVHSWRCEQGL